MRIAWVVLAVAIAIAFSLDARAQSAVTDTAPSLAPPSTCVPDCRGGFTCSAGRCVSDMAEFIDSMGSVNDKLRERLDEATKDKVAFRRFNDVLQEQPEERERWFAFQKERANRRIRRLLDSEGVYVVTP